MPDFSDPTVIEWVNIVLTTFGLVVIWFTLLLTKRSTEISGDALKQNRAWVTPAIVTTPVINELVVATTPFVEAKIIWHNSGESPATDISVTSLLGVIPREMPDEYIKLPEGEDLMWTPAWNIGFLGRDSVTAGAVALDDHEIAAAKTGNSDIVLYIKVNYRTIYEVKGVTTVVKRISYIEDTESPWRGIDVGALCSLS